jgi:hypothetical protein
MSTSTSVNTAVSPDVGANKPHIVQHIVCGGQVTIITVTFERADNKWTARFIIEPIDHSNISEVAEKWIGWVRRIINGEVFRTTPSGWDRYKDSQVCFLKVACLCNRVDEVYDLFQCTTAMRDEAVAWAKQYGYKHTRTWTRADEISIGACKLAFTLQKWDDNGDIACVSSRITGTEVENVRKLTTILSEIISIVSGEDRAWGISLDIHARVCVFADLLDTYQDLNFVPTDAHRQLAQEYESNCMIAHFEKRPLVWKLICQNTEYVLTKQAHTVTSANAAIHHTIHSVLTWQCVDLCKMIGGPQQWAEIAAFAGVTAYSDKIAGFASAIGVTLDQARIEAAATAGKEE